MKNRGMGDAFFFPKLAPFPSAIDAPSSSKRLEVLEWFTGSAGDHIDNAHYQRLFPELARMLGAGDDCKNPDKALEFMERLRKQQQG